MATRTPRNAATAELRVAVIDKESVELMRELGGILLVLCLRRRMTALTVRKQRNAIARTMLIGTATLDVSDDFALRFEPLVAKADEASDEVETCVALV